MKTTVQKLSRAALLATTAITANAAEQRTLFCPFPAPVLHIAILSWTGFEQGFLLEPAPTPNGPWTMLNATPVLQDGQNNVTVPMNSDPQFFRLANP